MNEKQFTISEVIDSFGITKHSLSSNRSTRYSTAMIS